MDYILGIFTGIGLALYAGHYFSERKKKQTVKDSGKVGIYINGKLVARATPMLFTGEELSYISRRDHTFNPETWKANPFRSELTELLERAIAIEDYEEAARLRDLMNKK